MNPRHPSRQRLQRWLDTGETRRVEAHIDQCQHCQSVLEDLTALSDEVVAELQTATAAPADLTARTNDGVDERLRNEAALGAFVDLFTIGWDVVRAIVDPITDSELAQPGAVVTDENEVEDVQ